VSNAAQMVASITTVNTTKTTVKSMWLDFMSLILVQIGGSERKKRWGVETDPNTLTAWTMSGLNAAEFGWKGYKLEAITETDPP
jgi:hypothetical protein